MHDEVTISYSFEFWQKRLAVYLVATGKRIREALDEEWPYLMRKIIDFTPPFRSGGKRGSTDLSVGRAAVAGDIHKVMRAFDPALISNRVLKKAVDTRNTALFNAIAANVKSGPMAGARAVPFDPAFHLERRNRRGRVPGAPRNIVVLGTDAVLLKNYVEAVQDRVGYAKSGWARAYNLVRAPDGAVLPAYITKFGGAGGAVVDERDNNPENPSVTAINRTPWASRRDEGERIKADAYYSRANALTTKVQVKMRLASKDAGWGKPGAN